MLRCERPPRPLRIHPSSRGGECDGATDSFDFDFQAGLSKGDLVARLQPNTASTRRNRNRSAVSQDTRSVQASIVTETIVSTTRCAFNMRMLSGHAQIRLSGRLRKSHIIPPDQTMAVVTNFGTSAQVDTRRCENVTPPFSLAVNNGQFQTLMRQFGMWRRSRRIG